MIVLTTGYEQDKNGDIDFPEKEYKIAIDTLKVSFARSINFKYKDELKPYCSIVFDNGEFIVVHYDFLKVYFDKS